MTNEEILKKAIEKAVENEYEYWDYLSIDNIYYSDIEPDIVSITFGDGRKENIGLYNIIFSHSFAKAFWGEKNREIGLDDYVKKWYGTMGAIGNIKEWRYHLQVMILEKEPLLYLEKFLEEN